MVEENTEPRNISRRGVIRAATWSVPVIAVTVATPLAAASVQTGPTDIGVTVQPAPATAGVPTTITYFGTEDVFGDAEPSPFTTASTATIIISGSFVGVTVAGASVTSDTGAGTDPRTLSVTITDVSGFSVQGTAAAATSVSTSVFTPGGTLIGSAQTTFA